MQGIWQGKWPCHLLQFLNKTSVMKKFSLTMTALSALFFFACKKSNDASQISLTPSATQVLVGEQLSVTLSAKANVSSWTVTPSYSATKTYGLTTSKVNY